MTLVIGIGIVITLIVGWVAWLESRHNHRNDWLLFGNEWTVEEVAAILVMFDREILTKEEVREMLGL